MKSLEDKLRTYITERGLRITPQRLAVLRAVIRLAPDHFDACRLLAALTLDKRTRGFARATVYRTLDHLVDAGILRRLHLASGAAVYELVAGGEHHEHLICERCGKIIEFESPEIESLQDKICRKLGFAPTSHILRIEGICRECGADAG
jgi:Fur family ferric uptake transcriptional regulator